MYQRTMHDSVQVMTRPGLISFPDQARKKICECVTTIIEERDKLKIKCNTSYNINGNQHFVEAVYSPLFPSEDLIQTFNRRLENDMREKMKPGSVLDEGHSDEETNFEELQCKICYANKMQVVSLPCGHRYCFRCARGTREKKMCFFCRKLICEYMRFY